MATEPLTIRFYKHIRFQTLTEPLPYKDNFNSYDKKQLDIWSFYV